LSTSINEKSAFPVSARGQGGKIGANTTGFCHFLPGGELGRPLWFEYGGEKKRAGLPDT